MNDGAIGSAPRVAWQPGSAAATPLQLGGFLATLEFDADEVRLHANAFARLRSGELQAVVVHRLFPPPELARIVGRLENHDPPFLQTWFPEAFRAWFFGQNINLSHPDLPGYFDEAARFNRQLDELLAPHGGMHHIAGVLSALDGGRTFCAAPGPQAGQRYMCTTLRAHLEGGYIPPHFDNEQALRPSYRHLRTLVDAHMLSFVLAFNATEGGGALEVFDLRCEPGNAVLLSDDAVKSRPRLDGLASVSFRLPPGSMIVLDSGRYLHRVTPVEGKCKRWTACSFMALARDGRAMYCWG